MKVAPYGSWKSPITSDLIVQETVALDRVMLEGDNVYWVELRPREGGRYVVVLLRRGEESVDVLPPPFNARTRVHEYGGGAFAVCQHTIYFSNFDDQRVYRVRPGTDPEPLTPEARLRYADLTVDPHRKRLLCVVEDHAPGGREATNSLGAIDLRSGGRHEILVSGNDFYSSPRLSPDGGRLAWLTWNHPNMPWDRTELWVAEVDADGHPVDPQLVVGSGDESIFQPEWSPDGVLHFTSDRTGWWNLYRWRDDEVEPLCEKEAEFGRPQWLFGFSTYAFESARRMACSYFEGGRWHLATLEVEGLKLDELETKFTVLANSLRASEGRVFCIAGSATVPLSVVAIDLAEGSTEVLRSSMGVSVDPQYQSKPEHIEFPTERGLSAYAYFYPPKNRDYRGPRAERPPLLVISHGGPTSATNDALNMSIQYWTSRGFGVLDVNYGGSTGYGREYRDRLRGQWGIVDVEDCINGARFLVDKGLVDGKRVAIRGGSAGGYTTLSALTFHDFFRAGASYFGVSDLEALAKETHKFESRYLDGLVGPYPEARKTYYERSPVHFVNRLSCPVILLQGMEDLVVPPSQAELIIESLRARGLPVAYVTFEGEQHGFRKAENIKRALESEYYFYSRVLEFDVADEVQPVHIFNM